MMMMTMTKLTNHLHYTQVESEIYIHKQKLKDLTSSKT